MLLRNSRVPVLLIFLLSTAIACQHQAVAASVPDRKATPQLKARTPGPRPDSEPAVSKSAAAESEAPAQPTQLNQRRSAEPSSADPGATDSEQGQASSDSGVFVFKKDVEEVVVHATVMDDKNHLVTNLDKSAFSVFENNQPQTITSFRHEDIPVAMGIVIDNSGSMREKRDKVNKAALNLVRSSNPQDQVFVVNFNDEYYLDQDFTSNINKLREALEKVEARGGTALYDAVVASADHLKDAQTAKENPVRGDRWRRQCQPEFAGGNSPQAAGGEWSDGVRHRLVGR